jgi:hypothetical protein
MFKNSFEYKCQPLQISANFFPSRPRPPHYRYFAIIVRHTTLGITPLDEWSARRKRSTWQHTTVTRERHTCPGGIRTRNPSERAAEDPRLRPCGQWDRQISALLCLNMYLLISRNMTSCFLGSNSALLKRWTMPLSYLTCLRQRLWWLSCGTWRHVISQITIHLRNGAGIFLVFKSITLR